MGLLESRFKQEVLAMSEKLPVPLARNLRKFREEKGLSLEEVAKKAGISKGYLWELERDTDGSKKPSAAVLMRIGEALSRTLAQLLELPTVSAPTGPVEIPPALSELRNRLRSQGQELSDEDLRDLASMRFRGTQPETADDWHQLYLLLASKARKPGG
jgi:transcriptional regulator with XRE-family HTH domain